MTTREKMIAGEWYDANFDEELLRVRLKTELLCHEYNNILPGSEKKAVAMASILGTKIPDGLTILSPVYFDYGINTVFGANVFVNHGCYFMDGAKITVGTNVFIGPFCGFYTATHPLAFAERNIGLEKALPIVVGDNCWFGANVSVMPGVTIGSGSVIAAGSVVTRDLPDNSLAAGVPAEVKKIIEQ